MANHPQNSPRGLFMKKKITVATATSGNGSSLTANSTALILSAGLSISSTTRYITANTTGIKIGSRYISTNVTGNLIT